MEKQNKTKHYHLNEFDVSYACTSEKWVLGWLEGWAVLFSWYESSSFQSFLMFLPSYLLIGSNNGSMKFMKIGSEYGAKVEFQIEMLIHVLDVC